jgi:hypothetical protein
MEVETAARRGSPRLGGGQTHAAAVADLPQDEPAFSLI